jgi:hypothetical protein
VNLVVRVAELDFHEPFLSIEKLPPLQQ